MSCLTCASAGLVGDIRQHAAVGKLILACLSWRFSTALTEIVLDQLTPVDLFGIEILVSAIPLAFLAVARGARPSRPDPMLLVLGVLEPGLTYVLIDLECDGRRHLTPRCYSHSTVRPRLPWPSCSCENELTFHSLRHL